MWRIIFCFLLVVWQVSLVGCGHGVNEGAVDYRFIRDIDVTQKAGGERLMPLQGTGKYHLFGINQANDKDMQPIKSGDSISLRLVQAYICDFREGAWYQFAETGNGNKGDCSCSGSPYASPHTSGEIAVILNVCEENKEGCSILYDGKSIERGRLVYYSEDVRETGQYLNFSNLPVYGPITYEGSPLYIDMAIMELDAEEAEKGKAVIQTLAGLGGKAYPPADLVLKTLNALGAAFLSGNQDDLEMRFHLNLEPSGGSGKVGRAPLTPGYYIFIRSEQRNKPIDWDNLSLNVKTGRLQHQSKVVSEGESTEEVNGKHDALQWTDWRQATYLVFKIDTNENTITQDSSQTFGVFLTEQKARTANDIKEMSDAFKKLEGSIAAIKSKDRLREVESTLDGDNAIEKKKAVLNFISSYCINSNNGTKGSEQLVSLKEKFNILDQISKKPFNPQKHCADQSKYVNTIGFK